MLKMPEAASCFPDHYVMESSHGSEAFCQDLLFFSAGDKKQLKNVLRNPLR